MPYMCRENASAHSQLKEILLMQCTYFIILFNDRQKYLPYEQ